MICLDNTDTLEGGASVDAVVDYTVHGLVGTTFTNIAQGQLSDTDPSVLYTAGAAISIVSVIFVNTHSAAVTVNLYLDPANAGTPRRLLPKALSLGIGYSAHYDGARLTILDASGRIATSLPQGLGTDASPTFVGETLSGLTASLPLFSGASKELVSKSVADTIVALGISDQTGWIPAGTFTYASAVTITVAAGAASIYQKGDKIKLTQATGGVKYFYIISVADALLTITGGSDYALVSEAITTPYYSHVENPLGFPDWFNYVPVLTGGNSDLSGYDTARFSIKGRTLSLWFAAITKNMSGSAGTTVVSLPVAGLQIQASIPVHIYDGAAHVTSDCELHPNVANLTFYKTAALGNWAANEVGVQILVNTFYEI